MQGRDCNSILAHWGTFVKNLHLAPGFRICYKPPRSRGDSVDYVNEMRRRSEKSLRETLEELAEWERESAEVPE